MGTFWVRIAWQHLLGQVIGDAGNFDVTAFSWFHDSYLTTLIQCLQLSNL
ncbi:MAG: hypothetical protein ANABAC_1270 [Anaerolineae bacterium]|nr:MAG: hypothetical protein ANABAC_1270 [Anaerolineae bacterium]